MKALLRNKSTFHYCLFVGEVLVIDDDGYETGEKSLSYQPAVEMKANISPATGSAQIEQFGSFISYDKVIVTDDMSCPIDEHTVLFVDKEPEYKDEEQTQPIHDYIVKRIAKSLNSISIAISKVEVS